MKFVYSGISADEVWKDALSHIVSNCVDNQDSRLGSMREVMHASFHIQDPKQRWVYSRIPPINPAFAIAELFWILSGDNDSAFLNYWNSKLHHYAGDAAQYHGAYGYRIRKQFGFDQLERAYLALKSNPDSRQVVIQIWDPQNDFPATDGSPVNEDIPCNISSLIKIRNGKLEWLQIMRSNDIFLGTPYNFLQFTTIQEILAGWLNVDVGEYTLVCDSLHLYSKDSEIVSIRNDEKFFTNVDTLAVSKERFDILLPFLYTTMHRLVATDLSKDYFVEILNLNNVEQAYMNLLYIAAAESARRRGWISEVREAIMRCTSELLVYIFTQWEERLAQTKKVL